MSLFFYTIFLWSFRVVTHVAALFDRKAQKWIAGRKGIFTKLENAIPADTKTIWVHCASLGEFEQGRPVIEQLKKKYKEYKILLTFFSPSGYEVQKNYSGADWVFYLPMDGPKNAKRFLDIVHPSLVIFVKYEFWFYYLKKIRYRNIPLILISALFRKEMSFFKWYGKLQRKMLSRFDHLFVQTRESKQLIDQLGLGAICSFAGDTRFDRVSEIAASVSPIPQIEAFINNQECIVAGSTWPEDEVVLQKAFTAMHKPGLKMIIAPHEITNKNLAAIKELFPGSILFSALTNDSGSGTEYDVLVIDNIGMLSKLYACATLAYVGGGLKPKGVHNILEAAVYGKPVLFGPYYKKYAEAVELVRTGGGIPFTDEKNNGIMLKELMTGLLANQEEYQSRSQAAKTFVHTNKGATERIISYIQEKRLLTSRSNT